ncbi:MAG: hypothetical protein M1833_006441 [Piccolia ochrophora]|nr:MAG: hypothetical protein M1833_006441 [Piccolia ochrophora]
MTPSDLNHSASATALDTDHAPADDVRPLQPSTQAMHADDYLNRTADVAPPLHVSTTYAYPHEPKDLVPANHLDLETFEGYIYSRMTAPNATRLEAILSTLLKGRALTYSSGLAAIHAAYVFLNPKRISIGDGYHGSHGVIDLHRKLTGAKKLPLDCPASELHEGDVIHLETPLNPTGEALNIAAFAEKAHSREAVLLVDATFGPPGLQDPFAFGADIVMHSGTKYLGGHSDMLCGVLAVRSKDIFWGLYNERVYLGSVMGSLEGWLGARSLRTLELRVQRQSQNASSLVAWLNALLHPDQASSGQDPSLSSGNAAMVGKTVERIAHASLQATDMDWLSKQMPNGYGPVFALWMQGEELARRLPSKLRLFHHATSLGGVESLVEWRRMSDAGCDPRLLRISVGVEHWEDLRDDLLHGFKALADEIGKGLP